MRCDVLGKIQNDKLKAFINYNDKLFREFIDLYREVNGQTSAKKAEKRFKWQFKDNPHGRPDCIKLFPYRGKIIGSIGTTPLMMKVNKSLKRVYFACDVMVSTAYQRKGLGLILLKKFMEAFGPIVLFRVKKDLFSILQRLDFGEIKELPYFVKIFDEKKFKKAQNIEGVLYKPTGKDICPRGGGSHISRVKAFDNEFTEFFNKVKGFYKFIVVRDKEYLNWKYAHHPYHRYMIVTSRDSRGRLNGYLIFRDTKTAGSYFGSIAEILTYPDDKKVINSLSAEALLYLRKKKVDFIETIVSSHAYRRELARLGFMDIGIRPGLFFFDRKGRFNSHMEDWFITKGDSDADLI